jgi:hypothetical protein
MIAQFALRLIVGMSLMWALMPRRDVTSGFFRIQMLVTLGLGVLAALTVDSGVADPSPASLVAFPSLAKCLCVGVAVVSFIGSVLWTLERRRGGALAGFLVLAQAVVADLLITPSPQPAGVGNLILAGLSELSTGSMVGGFVSAMLLGHWYLTAPTMTIRPLSRLNLFLGVFCGVRCLLSAVALTIEFPGQQTHLLWLALRWGAGIVGPAVLVLMVYRILKYRNTQAATGVLFVGVILTFIGELAATLLSREVGLPY